MTDQGQDFADRINRLPRWAMLAIAARNAWRVLPAAEAQGTVLEHAGKLTAANACCLIAMAASIDAGARRDRAKYVTSAMNRVSGAINNATRCVAAAAQADEV